MVCRGVPLWVIAGGRIVVEPGKEVQAVKGTGRYVPNQVYSEFVYGRLKQREKEAKSLKVEREPYTGPVIKI